MYIEYFADIHVKSILKMELIFIIFFNILFYRKVIYMDIFCKIIKGEIPSRVVFEDEIVKVIMDVNPRSNGHLLIIPKEHYQDLFDIDIDALSHIMEVSKKIGKLLTERLGCDGITLEQNNGIAQEVKHFHLHMIPKYDKKTEKEDIDSIYQKLMD